LHEIFTYKKSCDKIHLMFLKFEEVMIGGVNKKVDKVIIFIMKIRGVVEDSYLELTKQVKANFIINIF
jgi:hypothetical protein